MQALGLPAKCANFARFDVNVVVVVVVKPLLFLYVNVGGILFNACALCLYVMLVLMLLLPAACCVYVSNKFFFLFSLSLDC